MKKAKKPINKNQLIQLLVFALILIFSPLTHLDFRFSGFLIAISSLRILHLPILAWAFVIGLLFLAVINFKKLSRKQLISSFILLAFFLIGHSLSNFYLGNTLFDIAMNLHFLSFMAFAWLYYDYQKSRGIADAAIIRSGFFSGIVITIFSKMILSRMPSLIFDMSAIARNFWGLFMGFFMVYAVFENGRVLSKKDILPGNLNQIWGNPSSLLLQFGTLSLIFLAISALATSAIYLQIVFFLTIGIYLLFMFITRAINIPAFRITLTALLVLMILVQGFFFLKHKDDNIVECRENFVLYRGFPIYWFDFIVFPNGCFRLIDKKIEFSQSDRERLYKIGADIIIIGSGHEMTGGIGYVSPGMITSDMGYNRYLADISQNIILQTKDACNRFNSLKEKDKKVTLIVNNTK